MGGFLVKGESYARALATMRDSSWFELRSELEGKKQQGAELLVLIHPYWYGREGSDNTETCSVRGPRTFAVGRPRGAKCQSKELWGYDCPFDQVHLSADHRFPFSLGGPTLGTNLIWLCNVHNSAKAADWHLDDQKPRELAWFADVLVKVEHHVLDELRT